MSFSVAFTLCSVYLHHTSYWQMKKSCLLAEKKHRSYFFLSSCPRSWWPLKIRPVWRHHLHESLLQQACTVTHTPIRLSVPKLTIVDTKSVSVGCQHLKSSFTGTKPEPTKTSLSFSCASQHRQSTQSTHLSNNNNTACLCLDKLHIH